MDSLQHIDTLTLKLQKLELLIEEERNRPTSDDMLLHKLEMEHVQLAEQVENMKKD